MAFMYEKQTIKVPADWYLAFCLWSDCMFTMQDWFPAGYHDFIVQVYKGLHTYMHARMHRNAPTYARTHARTHTHTCTHTHQTGLCQINTKLHRSFVQPSKLSLVECVSALLRKSKSSNNKTGVDCDIFWISGTWNAPYFLFLPLLIVIWILSSHTHTHTLIKNFLSLQNLNVKDSKECCYYYNNS